MQFKDLNKYQKEAVINVDGPMRVIAGPGSGKTRTIIAKVTYILKEELTYPNQILVLAFTNKAANEVKKRLEKENQTLKNVFTFHSFAAYFLRLEAVRIGIERDYLILDKNDQNQIIKRDMKELSLEDETMGGISLKDVYEKFSIFSVFEQSMREFIPENKYDNIILNLYKRYKDYKKKINAYDFDDLLNTLEKVLKENEEVREVWKKRFKYIFVDEFQDINNVQYSIIRSLTNIDSNITVVGDPDQNIYSWRGSEIKYILNFAEDYQNTKTVILKVNYRSTKNIIDISNKLISHNKNRVNFEIEGIKDLGEQIRVRSFKSKFYQAEGIVSEIKRLNRIKKVPFNKMAIIYRANYISSDFENILAREGINYKLIGGLKFYDREEIKKMLFFIRFIIFQDDFSFLNIINFPPRKFGDKSVEKLDKLESLSPGGYWNELKKNQEKLKIRKEVKDFIKITDDFIDVFNSLKDGINFTNLFKEYITEIGIFDFYKGNENKVDNIKGFFEQADNLFSASNDLRNDLINFLNQTTLLSGSDDEDIENHVTLITAHASKGTEYDVVFLVSFNQKIFPSHQAADDGNLEEERRVAYVAITRAKDLLYITYVEGFDYDMQSSRPSIFLYDMDLMSRKYRSEKRENFFSSSDKEQDEEKDFSYELTKNNHTVRVENVVYHKKYGDGVVISLEEDIITVAFSKGIKKILKDHSSWYLKDK